MTMIEKVAKAIAGSYNYIDDERAKIYAKAAIEAMKEPTEEMKLKSGIPVHNAKLIWQDMINEALK